MLTTDRAHNLERALETNRDIGVAVGRLVERYQLDRTEAFAMLRRASQHQNRKIFAIAREIADNGVLREPKLGRRRD